MESPTILAVVIVLAILLIAAVAFAPRATQAYAAGGIAIVVVAALAARAVAQSGAAAAPADEAVVGAAEAPAGDAEDAKGAAEAPADDAGDEEPGCVAADVEVPRMGDFEQVGATRYSAPRPDHACQELCFFRRLDPGRKFKRVIDATAHVGVDTHVLAAAFGCAVDAVEPVKETYDALARNVKKFNQPGVRAINASAVDYLKTAGKADLVYMDPPWGGPGYKRVDDLPLYDDKGERTVPLGPVVNSALAVAPVVILKVPHNFNYGAFEQKIKGHIVDIARIKYQSLQYKRKRAVFLLLEIRKTPLSC